MVSRTEERQRMKKKMWLYGSYTKEAEALESQIQEIHCHDLQTMPLQTRMQNSEFVSEPASLIGGHPGNLELLALQAQIDEVYHQRSMLGLDAFLKALSPEEQALIEHLFIRGRSYRELEFSFSQSKSNLARRVNQLLVKRDPSRESEC